jgi:transcriptional regulator with XRE-family HTH domain
MSPRTPPTSSRRPRSATPNPLDNAGFLLKHARLSAGLTQLELAERLGISQASVSKLEHADSNPTVETLERALRATGKQLKLATVNWQPGVDVAAIARHLKLAPAERLDRFAEFAPAEILERLVAHSVNFVVVGGAAVVLQARPRAAAELDITYPTVAGNLESLGAALAELGAGAVGEAKLAAAALRSPQRAVLSTAAGAIRLHVRPAGAPTYPALRRRAAIVKLGSVKAAVASIADLIAMQRATGRPQDLIDVEALEQARQLQRPRRGPRPARSEST